MIFVHFSFQMHDFFGCAPFQTVPTAISLHLHFPDALFFRLGLFSNSPNRNYRVFFLDFDPVLRYKTVPTVISLHLRFPDALFLRLGLPQKEAGAESAPAF